MRKPAPTTSARFGARAVSLLAALALVIQLMLPLVDLGSVALADETDPAVTTEQTQPDADTTEQQTESAPVDAPPTVSATNIQVTAGPDGTAIVSYDGYLDASDDVGVADLSCDIPSGSVFTVGTTTVTCTATDTAGQTGSGSFQVVVDPAPAPTATQPAPAQPTETTAPEPTNAPAQPAATETTEPTATATAKPTRTREGSPTIVSDKDDYAPGERVTLTGGNWEPGENVHIYVNDDFGSSWSRNVDVTADADGNITDAFNLPNWFVADYIVRANGSVSGLVTTSFTDGNVTIRLPAAEGVASMVVTWERFNGTGSNPNLTCIGSPTASGSLTITSGSSANIPGFGGTTDSARLTSVTSTTPGKVFDRWTSGTNTTDSGTTLPGSPTPCISNGASGTNGNVTDAYAHFKVSNTAPTANNGSATVVEDSSNNPITLSATDPDGNTLTYTIVSGPTNGTLSGGTSASRTYTPNANFNGSDSFTFKVNDGTVDSNTATFTITVSAVNDNPDAVNDAATVAEDSSNNAIAVLTNDTIAPDAGETLTVTAVTQGAHGSVTFTATGVSYTPAPNYFGSDSFTYTITDNGKTNGANDFKTDTATVSVTVTNVNDNPDAVNDAATVGEDSGANAINVLGNDTFAPDAGETLSVTAITQGANGSVTFTATGVTYTPAANYFGPDSFTYTISDGNGGSDTATVSVSVTAVNDVPVPATDTATTPEDTTLYIAQATLTLNDSRGAANESGQSLTVSEVSNAVNGTVGIVATGEPDASGNVGKIRFVPTPDYHGTASFQYKVCDDGTPQQCSVATATVNVTVTAVNDAPVAVDDETTTPEDTAKTLTQANLKGNDTDVDNTNAQLSVTAVGNPSHGSVVLNDDGTVTFTPAANFFGEAGFDYTVSDGSLTDTGHVTVTVTAVNDAPTAAADTATVAEDSTNNAIDVLANDSTGPLNESGQTLAVTAVGTAAHGTVTFTPTGVSYTPNANYFGPDSFTYTVTDNGTTNGASDPKSATGTVSITVTNVNDNPVANDDSATVAEDSSNNPIDVLANDSIAPDAGETLTVTAVTQGTHGTVAFTTTGVSYTPALNYNGSDSFTYTISDGNGGSATATVNITVTSVNDAPVAGDDSRTTNEDTGFDVTFASLLANDTDIDGDTLNVVANSLSDPPHGTVVVNAGTISYSPDPDYFGSDYFNYTISDGSLTDVGTVFVTVNSVNDAPSFTNGVDQTVLEDAADQTVTNWATDISAGPSNESSQSITFLVTVTNDENGIFSTQPSVSPDGTLTYALVPDANGSATVSVVIQDNGGTANGGVNTSTAQTFTITVNAVNDAPSFTKGADQTVNEDAGAQNVPGWATAISKGPADESAQILTFLVTNDNNGLFSAQPAISATGTLTYTPATNANGSATVTVVLKDNGGTDNGGVDTSAEQTLTITVTNVNDDPVANADSATVAEDSGATAIDVLANDNSGVDSPETLSVTAVTQGAHGTVSFTATDVSYAPAANYNGPDSFTYTIGDGNGGSATATVTVTVTEVNDAPDAVDDSKTVAEDSGATAIAVLANDSTGPNEGEQTLTVTDVSDPLHGTVVLNGDGTISYTPAADYNGPDSFTYEITDDGTTNGANAFLSDTATVSITVTAVNDAPVAGDDEATTVEDTAVDINVLGNDADVDGDTLSVSDVGEPEHGTAELTLDGTITYTPAANYHGPDSFDYEVSDGNGGVDSATVTITVTSVNDIPTADDQSVDTDEDTDLEITLTGSDVDGDTLTFTVATDPSHGTLSGTGANLTYTPDADYFGPDFFNFTVDDGNGGTDTGTIFITVNPVNDAPVANTGSATTAEDTAVEITLVATDVDSATLTYSIVDGPSNGTLVAVSGNTVTYTPGTNFNGADSFTFKANDGSLDSNAATVSITVTAVNDPPVAVDQTLNDAHQGVAKTVTLEASDIDSANLTFTITQQPVHGTLGPIEDVTCTPTGSAPVGPGTHCTATVTYTADAGYEGLDSFKYKASDGSASDSANATVTIDVLNSAPVASAKSVSTDEETALPITLGATDADNDGLTYSIETGPSHGTLSAVTGNSVTYTPAPNYNGPDSFTFKANDGVADSNVATVSITVNPVNDDPAAADDTATVAEDSGANPIDVLANDSFAPDAGETLTVTAVTQGAHGAVAFTPTGVSYTPAVDYFGPDSFTYTVSDGNGGTDTATVSVTVTNVNDNPVANDDTATVAEDGGANPINVLANDSIAPDTGETLTVTAVSAAAHGTAALVSGQVRYTPTADYFGADSFTYTISDGNGGSATATVNVTVTAVNDAPDAINDSMSVAEDGSIIFDPRTNDSTGPANESGQTLTVTAVTQGAHGTVTFIGTSVTYSPAANYNGSDSFTYTVTDNGTTNGAADPKSDTATVSLTVTAVNDAPTVAIVSFTVDPATRLATTSTTYNDFDGLPDVKSLTFTYMNGNTQIASTTYTYTGSANGSQSNTTQLPAGCYSDLKVEVTITDNGNATGSATAATAITTDDLFQAVFQAPLKDNERNIVKPGNVVPIKVALISSCTGGTVTTQTLYIEVVKGAVGSDVVGGDEVLSISSVSAADTGTQLRVSGGGYIYNFSTKTMELSKDYTVRIRLGSPTGTIILTGVIQTKK